MSLEQYNRAKENQVYRHELELEMQRRARYLHQVELMRAFNREYYERDVQRLPSSFEDWINRGNHTQKLKGGVNK